MSKDYTYNNLFEVVRLLAGDGNQFDLSEDTLDKDLLSKINVPHVELKIYQRAIHEIKALWLDDTIKIDIEPNFIKEVLLKDVGLILKGLEEFPSKYPKDKGQGIEEAFQTMRSAQNSLMLAYKLFDPKTEPNGTKRLERQLKAFDECEHYLKQAHGHLERLEPKETKQ